MSYYTTETLASRAGCSPATARWYLRRAGFNPRITVNRYPRHHIVHSWGEDAAAFLHHKLSTRPYNTPDPTRWLPLSIGRANCGISRTHLYRLINGGKIRTRRALIKTPHGSRWCSFLLISDLATIPHRQHLQQQMPNATISALLRTWLLLLAAEQATNQRHLAAYLAGCNHLHLMDASGTTHTLPLTNPETCKTLPATYTTPPPAEQWAQATTSFTRAYEHQKKHKGSILSFDAASVVIWDRETKAHLAAFSLPH